MRHIGISPLPSAAVSLILPTAQTTSVVSPTHEIFNRLLRERIIFLGTEVDDDIANVICAQLLHLAGDESDRAYLLDYAGVAMRLTGLSMLQIQDGDGRILSSGHFRNEHGRVESGLAPALSSARGAVFLTARAAEGETVESVGTIS